MSEGCICTVAVALATAASPAAIAPVAAPAGAADAAQPRNAR